MATTDLVSAFILAIVQGITEWLPISSSGHLVLFERLLGFKGGLLFEVALHFGTLIAVFVYFRKDITDIMRDLLSGKSRTEHGRLGILLIIGSIPAGIVGFLVKDYFDTILSDYFILALGFMITGVLLLIASFKATTKDSALDWKKALIIGLAQAVSILPSISRSGATIACGVLLGLNEKSAMRFSFLLLAPAILGANLVTGTPGLSPEIIWGTVVTFIVGLATIHICFKYLLAKRENFKWFGLYALLLGIVIFIVRLLRFYGHLLKLKIAL